MKKARFKKGISNLLAATMVATMVAPALPAYAADSTFTIDLDSAFPGVFSQPFTFTGVGGSPISAPNGGTLPVFPGSASEHLMPFLQPNGTGGYKLADYNNMLANKGIDLSDYNITGWYESDSFGSNSPRYKFPSTLPSGMTTYKATRDQGNGLNEYVIKTELKLPGGLPIYLGSLSPSYAEHLLAGSTFTKVASPISGFKVKVPTTTSTTPGAEITMYKVTPKASNRGKDQYTDTTPTTNFLDALKWDGTTNMVTGHVVPADASIVINYEADHNVKKTLTVRDVFEYVDSSNHKKVLWNKSRPSNSYYASEDLPTGAAAIAPDSSLTTAASGGTPKYIFNRVEKSWRRR